jgi:dolichyl-phosphate beta-glucosyltransferase
MGNASPSAAAADAAPAAVEPELTLVIPAHNEASRLPGTLDALAEFLDRWGVDFRVLVVDDGSTDTTARLTAGRGPRFSTHSLPQNRGKGAAVRAGMLLAHSRLVAFMDADLPYALDCLRQAYALLQTGGPDVVLGARNMPDSGVHVRRPWLRRVATVVFRALTHRLISSQVSDTQTGFKMFRYSASQQTFSRTTLDGFAFDVEVIFLMHRLGLTFAQVPVDMINDKASTLSLRRHALPMLLDVFRVYLRAHLGWYDRQVPPAAGAASEQASTKAGGE